MLMSRLKLWKEALQRSGNITQDSQLNWTELSNMTECYTYKGIASTPIYQPANRTPPEASVLTLDTNFLLPVVSDLLYGPNDCLADWISSHTNIQLIGQL
jgi:hypothetical protein